MQLLYSNEQLILITNAKNILEAAGISSQIKNEFIAGAAGDLSPIDSWPELWVQDNDFDQAQQLIAQISSAPQQDWTCNYCKEDNGSAFESCWQCATDKAV